MTVEELIENLQEIEAQGMGKLPLMAEGCDCTRHVTGTELINRDPQNVIMIKT